MTEIEKLDNRISLAKAELDKRAEHYHYITLHGSEEQRKDELVKIRGLQEELLHLTQIRKMIGGENDGKTD